MSARGFVPLVDPFRDFNKAPMTPAERTRQSKENFRAGMIRHIQRMLQREGLFPSRSHVSAAWVQPDTLHVSVVIAGASEGELKIVRSALGDIIHEQGILALGTERFSVEYRSFVNGILAAHCSKAAF